MPPLEQTNIQTAFAVPIMLHQWDDCDALNQGLREAILEKEKRDTGGRSRSNIGGWHSQDDLDKWTGAAGKDLVQRIIGLVNHATSQIYTAAGETENDVRWSIGPLGQRESQGPLQQRPHSSIFDLVGCLLCRSRRPANVKRHSGGHAHLSEPKSRRYQHIFHQGIAAIIVGAPLGGPDGSVSELSSALRSPLRG